MKWGKTEEQLKAEKHVEQERLKRWRPHFAWWPLTLDDGRRAWLETVETRQEARSFGFFFGLKSEHMITVYRARYEGLSAMLLEKIDKLADDLSESREQLAHEKLLSAMSSAAKNKTTKRK